MLTENRRGYVIAEIREKYPVAGLYLASDPSKPLWTIDWFAFRVFLSSDGKHLVRMGPWPNSPKQLAIAFYESGRLLREYRIDQLVSDPVTLPHSVSHFQWLKDVRHDDAAGHIHVSTHNDEAYVFDMKTGDFVVGREAVPYAPANAADAALHADDLAALFKLEEDIEPALLVAIRTSRGKVAELAWAALGFRGLRSFDALLELSRDADPLMRRGAVAIMTEIASPRFAPRLLAMLDDANFDIRLGVIRGLFMLHEDKAATDAALGVLRTGSVQEQRQLLRSLHDFAPRPIVAELMARLDTPALDDPNHPSYPLVTAMYQWLESATLQHGIHLNINASPVPRPADALRAWWRDNSEQTVDVWFVQAVDRDLMLLASNDRSVQQSAFGHLQKLTGRDFGLREYTFDAAMLDAWRDWWAQNRHRRRGELLLESLRADGVSSVRYSTASQLHRSTDARDVPALIELYEWGMDSKSKNSVQKSARWSAEQALRHITNIDSFGCSFVGGERERQALEAWRNWVKEHQAE